MKKIRVDRNANAIIMTREFSKKAEDPYTEEYRLLQEVKRDNPNCVVRNHTIKKNPHKECYKGLTYDYMREYIRTHEAKANVEGALAELEDMIFISKCHSNGFRYPTIKKWFLEKYKDVVTFGTEIEEPTDRKAVEIIFSRADEEVA